MKKIISKAVSKVKAAASFVCDKAKTFIIAVAALFGTSMQALAQTLAGTGYDAGTNALEEVATELVKYVPYVVNLCYALAGVVAIVGAISVYIAMNNEEQDVKNILVLQNTFEKTRKQMKVNTLSINALSDNLNFPMFAKLILKKT